MENFSLFSFFNSPMTIFINGSIIFLFFCSIIYLIKNNIKINKEEKALNSIIDLFFNLNNESSKDIFNEIENKALSESITAKILSDIKIIDDRKGKIENLIVHFHKIYIPKKIKMFFFIAAIFVITITGLLIQINEIKIYYKFLAYSKINSNNFDHLYLVNKLDSYFNNLDSIISNLFLGLLTVLLLYALQQFLNHKNERIYSNIYRFTFNTMIPFYSTQSPEKSLNEISKTLHIVTETIQEEFMKLTEKILNNQNRYADLFDNLYLIIESIRESQKKLSHIYKNILNNLIKYNTTSNNLINEYKNSQMKFEDISNAIRSDKEDIEAFYKDLGNFFNELKKSFQKTITETAGILRSSSRLQDKEIQKIQKKLNQNESYK